MSLQRWIQDGQYLKAELEAAGYEVDLQYAGDNDVPIQLAQLENMILGGCDVLVIVAIDGFSLTNVLNDAVEQGVKVIAYDRLIMDTPAVSYYVTFDNFQVGVYQGSYVRDALNLDSAAGPFNIELFTGDPGDNNIHFFFGGAMSILQPYIDSGKLVVPSGQTTWQQVATPGWSTVNAQARMENLITSNGYGPNAVPLHAVMCSNDSTAQGAINGLVGGGYTPANVPVVTGQDADVANVKFMIQGMQSMSVWKDTRVLAAQALAMVNAILMGTEPEINDTSSYDNNTGIIPTFLCDPEVVTPANWQEKLIDGGYYQLREFADVLL